MRISTADRNLSPLTRPSNPFLRFASLFCLTAFSLDSALSRHCFRLDLFSRDVVPVLLPLASVPFHRLFLPAHDLHFLVHQPSPSSLSICFHDANLHADSLSLLLTDPLSFTLICACLPISHPRSITPSPLSRMSPSLPIAPASHLRTHTQSHSLPNQLSFSS